MKIQTSKSQVNAVVLTNKKITYVIKIHVRILSVIRLTKHEDANYRHLGLKCAKCHTKRAE